MVVSTKVRLRHRRHHRVRKKVAGTPERPRLAVFRSNRHIYAQVIDDTVGQTIAAASTISTPDGEDPRSRARAVGRAVAARAREAGVTRVTFDRGGFKYHGRVKEVADGAREGGLEL